MLIRKYYLDILHERIAYIYCHHIVRKHLTIIFQNEYKCISVSNERRYSMKYFVIITNLSSVMLKRYCVSILTKVVRMYIRESNKLKLAKQ